MGLPIEKNPSYLTKLGAVIESIAAQYPSINISTIKRGGNTMLNSVFINQAVTTFIEENTELKEVIVTEINQKHAIFQAETKEAGVKIFRLREYSDEYQISIEGGHKWDHYKLIDKWEHSQRIYKGGNK